MLTYFSELTAFRKDSFSLKNAFILTLRSIHFDLDAVLPTAELKDYCFYFCLRFVAADRLFLRLVFIRYFSKFQSQEDTIISDLLQEYLPITI